MLNITERDTTCIRVVHQVPSATVCGVHRHFLSPWCSLQEIKVKAYYSFHAMIGSDIRQ